MTIDDIDLRILDMLQRNGKLSQAKIAGAVGLTTPSVNERIKKMERHGMIKGFVALLDHEKMGFPLTAYVDVALEHPRFEKGFVDDLEKLLGVQECHYLAGEYAYRLKVKAADTGALADFLQRRLLSIKGVTRTRTEISLSSKKESTLLPLVIETGRKVAREENLPPASRPPLPPRRRFFFFSPGQGRENNSFFLPKPPPFSRPRPPRSGPAAAPSTP